MRQSAWFILSQNELFNRNLKKKKLWKSWKVNKGLNWMTLGCHSVIQPNPRVPFLGEGGRWKRKCFVILSLTPLLQPSCRKFCFHPVSKKVTSSQYLYFPQVVGWFYLYIFLLFLCGRYLMKKEGLIFNSQAKADISDMGRIEELRCFSRFVEVKAANISSLFLLVSSNVFFYWENFVQQVKDIFFMHILKILTFISELKSKLELALFR